ncbi:DNAJ protein Spf31 [Schizosaccharomyces octosporus yFS286]|uniref:DNAJ protein Spf31 n=1 Tax=Schizosaccharomyces octosporus (strain yFS286) TaxID=483514 RepID=S9R7S4_SCHOY|nr:DNAJ protein Spf31 [Schizosaccharomyces octosporus yFS286]EPX74285.1 DNAJ protein Spf31 [Schizosaccharomyces octosporus yFS286]
MTDVDKLLNRVETTLNKGREIERIIASFKLNAYDVLGILPGITVDDIDNLYRKKSLMIHPDKNRENPKAADAFNFLKKAQSDLHNENLRDSLDSAYTTARNQLIAEKKLKWDSEEVKSEEFLFDLRIRWRDILIEDEIARRRARQLELSYQQREQAKKDEETKDRKRRMESDKVWEETRDERVNNWQDYLHKTKKSTIKKKNKKPKVLG